MRELLDKHQTKLHHDGGNRAFYSAATDSIHVPKAGSFQDPISYASTVLHELAHWTKAPARPRSNRAIRDGGVCQEELVAELSSLFISERLGLPQVSTKSSTPPHLQSWMKALADDPRTLFRAASQAEKVMTFLDILTPGGEPPQVKKEQGMEQGRKVKPAEGIHRDARNARLLNAGGD